MAFKEKSERQIVAMSDDERIKYWKDFKAYYVLQKREAQKKVNEAKKNENAKNKKRLNHARFVLFGALLEQKWDDVKELLKTLDTSNFTKTDVADCNLLMRSLGWSVEFKS